MNGVKTSSSVDEFGRRFSTALTQVVDGQREKFTRIDIAHHLKRSNTYVGDRLRGTAPMSVDVVAAVADLMKTDPASLVRIVLTMMDDPLVERKFGGRLA